MPYEQLKQGVISQIQRAEDVEQLDVIIRAHLNALGDYESQPLDFPALAAQYPGDKDIYDAAYEKEFDLLENMDLIIY